MKRELLMVAFAIAMLVGIITACGPSAEEKAAMHKEQMIAESDYGFEMNAAEDIIPIKHDGHVYLVFVPKGSEQFCVLPDPECPKCLNRLNLEPQHEVEP